ncbi:MAG: SCO6745 family protein [Jatrophihabitans sp.]|uniref:SCO6745 family protein n=1 Tax=Jatrophihabitans sp. TaxID=1932789 RepID=UPI003F7F38AA
MTTAAPDPDTAAAALAGRAHRATDTLHSLIYFVPEADEEFSAVGLRPGRMHYFASRSAPMGPVGAAVTAATFHNFNPALVAKYIPRAWTLASIDDILAARLRVVDRAYRRLGLLEHAAEIDELAQLLREAAGDLPVEGRPLFAGHAELAWPDEPHLVLWHAVTLLREYRGDGHIAALVTAGLSGLEAIITHCATGRGMTVAAARHLRGWSEDDWAAGEAGLRERGLLDGSELTPAGVELRATIEATTDRLDTAAWSRLGEQRTLRAIELGKQLSREVVATGVFGSGVFGR